MRFILLGGITGICVSLIVVAVVGMIFAWMADTRRHRRDVEADAGRRLPHPNRLVWIGILDLIIGIPGGVLGGLMTVTILDKELPTTDWMPVVPEVAGWVGWFVIGLMMIVLGVRRLGGKCEPFITSLSLRLCCVSIAAALVVWEHYHLSESPGDPAGVLKDVVYVLRVGIAGLQFSYLLASTVFIRRKSTPPAHSIG